VSAPANLANHHGDEGRVVTPRAQEDLDEAQELLVGRFVRGLHAREPRKQLAPVLAEDRLEHLVLRREVVVEQAVRDTRLLGDVPDPGGVEPAPREHEHGGVEDPLTRLLRSALPVPGRALARDRTVSQRPVRIGAVPDTAQQPLTGMLVVDLTRYLPGAFASRELLRLGARVVRVEAPEGDPMRRTAPAWDDALRRGKESVVCDLKSDAALARALCARADVVLEGFRPGVAARLGIGPDDVPAHVLYCSITGFGTEGRHADRVGHDLNYLGWAGTLEDTAPALPPVQVADLAAGALRAVAEVLAALVGRERTGRGARLVVSMTHGAHELAAHRLGGDPLPRLLTGGLACYETYATADGRHLTLAALEPAFFARVCEILDVPELAARQYEPDQAALRAELSALFARRALADWLDVFDDEEACVGPVATLAEAHADLGPWPEPPPDVPLGAHTEPWRAELALA
jgi:alpha-methylacyl-CoA racemase